MCRLASGFVMNCILWFLLPLLCHAQTDAPMPLPIRQPQFVPKIDYSASLSESLWVSSHEVLRLCQPDLKNFALVDAVSGRETSLPGLTAIWAAQTAFFDCFALRVSPDGHWLLGPAGTKDKPTWLVASIRGDKHYEWPREETDMLRHNIAWMQDGRRWVEVAKVGLDPKDLGGDRRRYSATRTWVRVFTIGAPDVVTYPLQEEDSTVADPDVFFYCGDIDGDQFTFTEDGRAWLVSGVFHGHFQDGPRPDLCRAFFYELLPGSGVWTVRRSEIAPQELSDSEEADECRLSPDGSRLLWRCCPVGGKGPARFVLSQLDGTGMRAVYEGDQWPRLAHWVGDDWIAFWESKGPTGCGYYTLDLPNYENVADTLQHGAFPTRPAAKQLVAKR